MKAYTQPFLFAIAAVAFAGTVYAQQPPDVVASDAIGNTAMGTDALLSTFSNCIGPPTCNSGNTATGYEALYSSTGGSANTAVGAQALYSNANSGFPGTLQPWNGNANTAVGYQALYSNITGQENTAVGYQALYSNTLIYNQGNPEVGYFNTATGGEALFGNTTGSNNTASGYRALYLNTKGSNNIAEGFQAGINLTTGSNNIDIGNAGVSGESDLIRIGTKGTHKGAIIAGINNSQVTGSAVYVTSAGRLGVLASSQRYKTAITPIGDKTDGLRKLRPVSFHLKADPKGALQYGLIAEEVAQVYPELVVRNESGGVEGVRYDELPPMLLNEVQKQHEMITAQTIEIRRLKRQQAHLITRSELQQAVQAALGKLRSQDAVVAQR